jgi:hypothetical protein
MPNCGMALKVWTKKRHWKGNKGNWKKRNGESLPKTEMKLPCVPYHLPNGKLVLREAVTV